MHRLLLPICVLLGLVVLALTAWSYASARDAMLRWQLTRLDGCARVLGTILADGARTQLRAVDRIAAHSALRAWLATPEDEPAKQAVQRLVGSTPAVLEVWDAAGECVGRWTTAVPAGSEPSPLYTHRSAPPAGTGMQPLRRVADMPFLEAVAEVGGEDVPPAARGARVVLRRGLTGAAAASTLSQLIGPSAAFCVGNTDGDVWTDLKRPLPVPALDAIGRRATFASPAGAHRLGALATVEGTPWRVVVEADADEAFATANELLGHLLLVGVAVLLLGAAGAAWISHRFAGPLRDATEAAEAVAAGRLDHRLPQAGTAEVRRLARAFNVMADRVEDARAELEARVVQRTEDLRCALDQLRNAQDELVRKEKLALLGQLAGGVGHELRNPLGVMANAVFYLEMVLDPSPEVREYLRILRQQIQLSEKIIADLLDFGRSRTPIAQAVRLEDVVEAQVADRPASIEVVRDFSADAPPACVDPVHATQILRNLVLNAMQAMGPRGGTLRVGTRRHGESQVCVQVADSGPGVAPELRERIFEPLFTTRARGIGLGLAVSRQLAAMNAGELRLEPPGPGGATFSLILPAASEVAAVSETRPEPRHGRRHA